MTIQMKTAEQYFPVVMFIKLHKVVPTLETVDKILKYALNNIQMKAILKPVVTCTLHFTSSSDHFVISPYIVNTLSTRQVMRIKKIINWLFSKLEIVLQLQ